MLFWSNINTTNNVKREDKNMSKRIIEFGTWNGNPMKWAVLYENDFDMLVLSEISLGRKQYSAADNSNWASSDIRQYLNNNFYKSNFTEDEKKRIMNIYLNDSCTKDNIFLISKSESDSYLSSDEVHKRGYWCTRTPYDSWNIIRYGGSSWGNNESRVEYETYPAMHLKKLKSDE